MDSQTEFPVEKSEDVVLDIPEESRSEEKKPNLADSDSNLDFLQEFPYVKPKAPCPEISKPAGMNPKKAPRSPQPGGHIRRRSITKPKSRFEEPVNSSHSSHALDAPDRLSSSAYNESPDKKASRALNTLLPNIDEEEEEEDNDVYKKELLQETEKRRKKVKIWLIIEWLMLILATACLIASLLVQRLQGYVIWYLEIWKWCLMMIVIFCGQLITYWFISVLVFLIEINFLFRKKVLYFVYGVQKSVQVCVWLGLVLLSWSLIFNGKVVPKSLKTAIAFNYVSRVLASLFIGSDIWLAKTLLVKILASSFHMNRFFDRIQETLYHQYLLQALSGPPIMEMVEKVGPRKSSAQFSFKTIVKSKGKGKIEELEVIDIGKLHRISQEKVSAWTMRGLINVIISSGLSTISNKIDENFGEDRGKQKDKEITNEVEARAAAYKIFKRVAKPGYQYIEVEDLMRFSNDEEITYMFPLFEGALESGIIKRSALRNWVVKAYLDRKSLVHSLNDTKLAVDKLHKLLSTIVIFVIIIITLLIMGFATTKVLVLISSQILLVGFIFTNSCKTAFEAIIFVFVMHPFDVGDRCVIDGVQMIVEEMNILSTVLLQSNNAKIYYPNAVLATKPIKNFYRSPDMGDSVEFSVDISTSMERINALKASIKAYIDSRPNHWRHEHSIKVKDIMDISKIEIILYVTHTMNYQNIIKKDNRRTDLILQLKKIFEDLSIQYNLLPREVQFSYVGSTPLPVAVFHDRV